MGQGLFCLGLGEGEGSKREWDKGNTQQAMQDKHASRRTGEGREGERGGENEGRGGQHMSVCVCVCLPNSTLLLQLWCLLSHVMVVLHCVVLQVQGARHAAPLEWGFERPGCAARQDYSPGGKSLVRGG